MNAQKTPMYELHLEQGARMVDYAGVALPIQYEGTLAEHKAAREGAALFDTSHMGRIDLDGSGCIEALEPLLSCPVGTLTQGRCRYGLLTDAEGGVRDDIIFYRLEPQRVRLVTNAATRLGDVDWLRAQLPGAVRLEDRTEHEAKIDLQGPLAPRIAAQLLERPLNGMRYFAFHWNRFDGVDVLLSRTGYTGEIGFELYLPPAAARQFWRRACELGARPAGLGARDILRLEVGLPLYGHELSREIRAGETGLDWAIDPTKAFVGAERIRDPSANPRRLVGLRIEGRRTARAQDAVLQDKRRVGGVTSGGYAPSLGHAVAFALVERQCAAPGTRLTLAARQPLAAEVVKTPFYRDGTARHPIDDYLPAP